METWGGERDDATGDGDPPRSCYCGEGDTSCGTCDVCGAPGHVRAHPGGGPVSGAWCDACYAQVAAAVSVNRFHPLRLLPWLLLLLPVAWAAWLILRGK